MHYGYGSVRFGSRKRREGGWVRLLGVARFGSEALIDHALEGIVSREWMCTPEIPVVYN